VTGRGAGCCAYIHDAHMQETWLSSCVWASRYGYIAAGSFMHFVTGRQPRCLQNNVK